MHFFTPEEQVTGRLCVDAQCSLRRPSSSSAARLSTTSMQLYRHSKTSLQLLRSPDASSILHKNIWRRIEQSGLQIHYGSEPEFNLNARCLAAVTFLPTEGIVPGFEQITQDDKYPDKLDPVVDYFESIYIGNNGRGLRQC